jgi:hypothetical protein
MVSRTAALTNVPIAVRTGFTLLNSISIRQKTNDAPQLYLQLWNTAAASVTIGTTAPVMVIPVPAGSTKVEDASLKVTFSGKHGGRQFSTALSYAVATVHDGGTACDAGDEPEVIVNYEALG